MSPAISKMARVHIITTAPRQMWEGLIPNFLLIFLKN